MKRMYEIPVVVLALVSLSWSQPANYKWYPFGLEKIRINCILADDTARILAGTDSGIMVRFGDRWYPATSGLPVRALARVSEGRVAAAISGGNQADGIYLGRNVLNGPPFYSFEILWNMSKPEALAVSGPALDTLYAGSGTKLVRCAIPELIDPTFVITPEEIKLPPGAFGVEQPSCRTLKIVPASNQLVAGGYDRGPMAGKSYLLRNVDITER